MPLGSWHYFLIDVLESSIKKYHVLKAWMVSWGHIPRAHVFKMKRFSERWIEDFNQKGKRPKIHTPPPLYLWLSSSYNAALTSCTVHKKVIFFMRLKEACKESVGKTVRRGSSRIEKKLSRVVSWHEKEEEHRRVEEIW